MKNQQKQNKLRNKQLSRADNQYNDYYNKAGKVGFEYSDLLLEHGYRKIRTEAEFDSICMPYIDFLSTLQDYEEYAQLCLTVGQRNFKSPDIMQQFLQTFDYLYSVIPIIIQGGELNTQYFIDYFDPKNQILIGYHNCRSTVDDMYKMYSEMKWPFIEGLNNDIQERYHNYKIMKDRQKTGILRIEPSPFELKQIQMKRDQEYCDNLKTPSNKKRVKIEEALQKPRPNYEISPSYQNKQSSYQDKQINEWQVLIEEQSPEYIKNNYQNNNYLQKMVQQQKIIPQFDLEFQIQSNNDLNEQQTRRLEQIIEDQKNEIEKLSKKVEMFKNQAFLERSKYDELKEQIQDQNAFKIQNDLIIQRNYRLDVENKKLMKQHKNETDDLRRQIISLKKQIDGLFPCVVCFGNFALTEFYIRQECGHIICDGCYRAWNINDKCHYCQGKCDQENVIKLDKFYPLDKQ